MAGQRSEILPTKMTSFGYPGKSNNSCLLNLFITQSGSCKLRPPRLLLCCFPLHRRQTSSDITSSPLSSTATKTQTCKGLAWRLNKSACNSANYYRTWHLSWMDEPPPPRYIFARYYECISPKTAPYMSSYIEGAALYPKTMMTMNIYMYYRYIYWTCLSNQEIRFRPGFEPSTP